MGFYQHQLLWNRGFFHRGILGIIGGFLAVTKGITFFNFEIYPSYADSTHVTFLSMLLLFKNNMNLFWKKFKCEKCESKFSKYEDLISHARHEHHHEIIKCMECGKEFIYEADRLHHSRKEHEKKMFGRVHKYGNKHEKKSSSPQDDVDKYTGHFSDKL